MSRSVVDDDASFRRRVRRALDGHQGEFALARIEFDRLDRVAEYFGEGVAEFVQDELVLRMVDVATDSGGVFCPPGGMAMVLVPVEADETGDLTSVAWALMEKLSAAIDVGISQVSIGCTVGLADPSVLVDRSVAGLINAASAASRRASSMGSRSAAAFEGTHELTGRRGELDRSIFSALGTDQISVWFQPQVRLADGVIVGAEALVRWNHPRFGTVAAEEFMPEARRSGLVREIDRLVMKQAAHAAVGWPRDVRVAMDLSSASLDNPGLTGEITACFDRAGLALDRVTFEVSSARRTRGLEGNVRQLESLKAGGARLTLGDWGTAHDYVELLGDGLFDDLKIDESLIHGRDGHVNRPALAALVEFAQAMGLSVIADGVSTPAELEAVASAGCPVGQGDELYPPLPEGELRALLAAGRYQG